MQAIRSRIQALGLSLGVLACAALALPVLSQAAEVEIEAAPGSLSFAPTLVGAESEGQNVFFTNRGSETISIEGSFLADEGIREFQIDSSCGGELHPNETCEIGVSFAPLRQGARSAELRLAVATDGSEIGIPLSGIGLVKALDLPTTVGFGAVTRGASTEQGISVANGGNASVSISKFDLGGPDSGDFAMVTNNCPGSLGPAMACEVRLRFTPSGVGAEQAELRAITDGTPSEPSTELTAEGVAAELAFEPSSEDFGLVEVHSEGPEATLELKNAGTAQVHLEALQISGPGANEFFIGNSNCYGAILLPSQSCRVAVHFSPQNEGTFNAAVRAQVDGGAAFEAALTGRGARPIVTATPNPADFGEAGVGTHGSPHSLTLTNSGELPVSFFIAIISGGDVASFHMVEEDCTGRMIEPAEGCTAVISFSPAGAGARKATASFFGGGEGALQIPLSGFGVATKVSLGPAAHDFGAQAPGTAGPAQPFQMTNEGGAPLEVDTAAISGLDADQFRIAVDTCAETTLAAGASCSLGVRFAPDGTGTKGAVLRVRTSAGTQTAMLTGQGAAAPPASAAGGAAPASDSGRVGFEFAKSLRLGQAGNNALKVAAGRCESSATCVVQISATLLAKFHQGGGLVTRQVRIPNAKVTLKPATSGPLTIKVGALGNGFAAAKSRLKVQLHWSTSGAEGKWSRTPRLHG
jgi:hypothetical protein